MIWGETDNLFCVQMSPFLPSMTWVIDSWAVMEGLVKISYVLRAVFRYSKKHKKKAVTSSRSLQAGGKNCLTCKPSFPLTCSNTNNLYLKIHDLQKEPFSCTRNESWSWRVSWRRAGQAARQEMLRRHLGSKIMYPSTAQVASVI